MNTTPMNSNDMVAAQLSSSSRVPNPVELNNSSVDAIETGRHYDVAVANLTAALKVTKQLMATAAAAALSSSQSASSRSDMYSSSPTSKQRNADTTPSTISLDDFMRRCDNKMETDHEDHMIINDVDDDDDDQDTPYVYRRLIRVTDSSIDVASKESLMVLSATVVFNLALAQHLAAADGTVSQFKGLVTVMSHERRVKFLKKAVTLYELAYNLNQDSIMSMNPLFMMAIVNNMAVVHLSMCQYESAQVYFQHLLSTIMFFSASTASSSNSNNNEGVRFSSIFNNADCQREQAGFFRNISFLISRVTAAGAA